MALLSALVLQACGAAGEDERGEPVASVSQAVTGPVSFSIAMPSDMVPQSTAVWASERLRLADRVLVRGKQDRYARVVNVGQELTELGVEAKTGNIWAGKDLMLRDRARVEGNAIAAAQLIKQNGAVVTGLARENTPLGVLKVSTWEPTLPSQTLGDANLEPDHTRVLPPGGYRQASIKSRSTLSLSAGTYVFDNLSIESQAKLAVDDSAGPVVVYVNSQLTFRGSIIDATLSPDDKVGLLIVVRGSSQTNIEAPFKGTVFAPAGSLYLGPLDGVAHFGAFFGKTVNVEAGVIINHRTFPWSQLLPPNTFEWKDAPVVLKPAVGTGGDITATGVAEATPEAPVNFTVPPDFWVSSGNAGNGKLELRFREPNGTNVVCQYKGGATVANPTTDFEKAKGRRYLFVSCSNGLGAGAGATGTWFKLGIVSSSSNVKETVVEAHLGGGCSGTLPPALNPAEVVALRDNFDWRTTDTLAETDPQGRPALWHGMIYIERKEQLQALDRWRVKWSPTPFSRTYLDKYAGKCGRMEHASDGKGVIVYAIFPAKLFNMMRNVSAQALVVGDPAYPPPFKVWVPTPVDDAEYVNSDGSLKYEALASTGYPEWLASGGAQPFWEIFEPITQPIFDAVGWVDDNVTEPLLDYGEDGLSYIGKAWDSFVDWAANGIDNVWESAQEFFGTIAKFFGEEIEVKLEVHMLSRESLMPGRMFRTWGAPVPPGGNTGSVPPNLGRRPWLEPHGVQVRIRQWGWGFVPMMSEGTLPAGGQPVVIKAVEGSEGQGNNQLCIELESDAGSITSDLIPNEVCALDGPVFDDFEHSTSNVLVTNQQDLHAMTQIIDSFDYVKEIIEVEPKTVQVLTGWLANDATAFLNGGITGPFNDDERAMALCLDFASINATAVSGAFAAVGGYTFSPLLMQDIWWPDTGDAIDSRTMTHEYGHFLMCSLLYDEDGPSALGPLLGRVGEGQNDSPDDTMTIATEAWADTFAMQVIGASNYISPHLARDAADSNMSYCQPNCTGSDCDETPTCMDYNYFGEGSYPHDPVARTARLEGYIKDLEDDEPDLSAQERKDIARQKLRFFEELARVESQVHDLFDRGDSLQRETNEVWNGDVLDRTGKFSTSGYLAFADERVSMPGPAWRGWAANWAASGPDMDATGMLRALNETAADYSHNWCERCEAFSLHSTYAGFRGRADLDALTAVADRPAHWRACAQGQVDYFDDTPPEKYGNLSPLCTPCPNLQFSDVSNGGRCTACPAGEVPRGDHCQACPDGTEPGADNECVSCGPTEISANGVCVPCRFAEGADRATNTCVDCNADATLDWRTVGNPVCLPAYGELLVPLQPAANDNCPDLTWAEVTNLDVLADQDRAGLVTDVVPDRMFDAPFTGPGSWLQSAIEQALCPSYQVALLGYVPDPASPTHAWAFTRGHSGPGVWQACVGEPWCPSASAESCVWNAEVAYTADEIAAAGNRLRFRAHGSFGTQQAIPVRLLFTADRPEGPVCEPD